MSELTRLGTRAAIALSLVAAMAFPLLLLSSGSAMAQTQGLSRDAVTTPAQQAAPLALPTPQQIPPAEDEGIVIRTIAVEGNQRVEDDTVRAYMVFKAGEPYSVARVDQSLKDLFDTGLFADITIRRVGNELIVSVVENPIINRVVFEGNDDISDEDLEAEVQLTPRTIFTRAKVQADVQRIVELYRRRGRFSATVEPKVIQLPQNRVDLVFEISEGPITEVAAINFLGNEAYSDGTLRGVIATKESAFWRIFSSDDNYDPDRLNYDRELLRRYYLARGYADFRVVSAVADLSPDGSAFYITFTLDEGPIYTFGDIEVETALDEINPELLRELVSTKSGETYDAGAIEESVDEIVFEAGTKGYGFAEVRPRVQREREERIVNLTYVVNEGPRVYVERINIIGNTRTQDKVIRRELLLAEGDAFNRVLLDRSRRNIRALQYFSVVEVTEEPGSEEDKTIVNIEVEEQATGSLQFGIGFSTVDNALLDFSLTEANLLGRGQSIRFASALSFNRQQVDIRFTDPYFLDRELLFGFDIIGTQSDFQNEASFNQRIAGFGFRFGFPTSENASLNLRYTLEYEDIFNIANNASPAVRDAEGSEIRSSVGYDYFIDMTDDPILPTSGWDFLIGQEFAGLGGSVSFLRNDVRAHYYIPVIEGVVITERLDGGYIFGLFGEDVRLNDRYFRGGGSFRGFDRLGLGPRDIVSKDALGAQAYIFGTTEVSFPNFLPEALGIRTSIFSDYGYIGITDEQERIYSIPGDPNSLLLQDVQDGFDFRVSAGLSVYWQSPFGPVRFDLAKVLRSEFYDQEEIFRFSAGTSF